MKFWGFNKSVTPCHNINKLNRTFEKKIIRRHTTDKICKYKSSFYLPETNAVSAVHFYVIKISAAFLPVVNIQAESAPEK